MANPDMDRVKEALGLVASYILVLDENGHYVVSDKATEDRLTAMGVRIAELARQIGAPGP